MREEGFLTPYIFQKDDAGKTVEGASIAEVMKTAEVVLIVGAVKIGEVASMGRW